MPITQQRMKVSKTNKTNKQKPCLLLQQHPGNNHRFCLNYYEIAKNPSEIPPAPASGRDCVEQAALDSPRPLSFSAACEESPAPQKWLTEAHTEEQHSAWIFPSSWKFQPGLGAWRSLQACTGLLEQSALQERGMHSKSKGLPQGCGAFQDRQEPKPKRCWQERLSTHMVLLRTECPRHSERK